MELAWNKLWTIRWESELEVKQENISNAASLRVKERERESCSETYK